MLPIMLGSGILSLYELLKGQSELNKLHNQAVPSFSETPEMRASRARADRMAEGGFTPQERASFRGNIAQDINTKTQNALNLGGSSLSRVISGIGKMDQTAAENKFASSDAALHRQNIRYADTFSKQLQDLSNMNIQKQLPQRLLAEQALGKGVQTGLKGLADTANLAQIIGFDKTKNGTDETVTDVTKEAPAQATYGYNPLPQTGFNEMQPPKPDYSRNLDLIGLFNLLKKG